MYLFDTVILSATRLPDRNPVVRDWIGAHKDEPWFISALTVGEIRIGIETAPSAALRAELEEWLADIVETYSDLILPFGLREAQAWGRIAAPFELSGQPAALVDSQIAATARVHGLTVVTRNSRHFERFGVQLLNPWDGENGA
jgi:predicted nucleic acid-binding protein